MSIFISHSFKDTAAFTSTCLALEGQGACSWDVCTLPVGQPLASELKKAIRECDICVFIATSNSIESKWCLAELGAFWGVGKPVIIFVADPNVKEEDLPPQFKGNFWTNDANRLIEAIRKYDPLEANLPLSAGMVYLLLELSSSGLKIRDLASLWKKFNDSDKHAIPEHETAKYACQCLEALNLVDLVGGDEYVITEFGSNLLKYESLKQRFGSAFAFKTSAEELG